MNERTILDLNFGTENGNSRKLQISGPKLNLTEEEVKEAMQAIIDTQLFEQDGVRLYEEIRSARYVTTAVDEVFEVE